MKARTRPSFWLMLLFGPWWPGNGQIVADQPVPLDHARSPDQQYEWRVRTEDPVRYELTELPGLRVLATVKDYFWDQDQKWAVRHAREAIVRWNATSSLVALDEFNYRRAGRLWVFWLKGNQAHPVSFEGAIKAPVRTTEKRFCLAQGWRSPTLLSIRLAAHLASGEVIGKAYLLDLADPTHPKLN
jgi:hypothetical protein